MEFRTLLLFLLVCFIPERSFASPLSIAQDETPNNYYHWSSAIRFVEDESTVSSQLPSLAREAYEEMLEDAKDRGIAQIPSTMAAFAVGSDVYFSSGLIGASFLINPGQVENFVQEGVAEEVALAIIRCQQTYSGDHHYNMRCAEPLAIQQYLVNNQGTSIIGKGKISTYGVLNVDNKSLVGILDPCNRGLGNWGCEVFLNKLQIPKVGNNKDQPGPSSVHTTQPPLKHCFWTE